MKLFDAVPPPVGSGETPELYRLPGLKFQALCRDLLDSGGDPEISACREYGTPGQRQHGIDLIADRQDGGIDVAQCKCERDFPPKKIRDASDEFLKYIDFWRSKGLKRFIVLVGSEVLQTQRQAEIFRQKELFKGQHGISYELWPSTRVVNRLRSFRGIVSQHLSPGWVDILCGPTTESSVQTELAQHAALIDHLVLALTGATDERLLAMREVWREGRRYEAQRMLTLTKADGFTWNALPPNVRASYLRFEGSVILESEGDTSRAAALVDEAHALHASPDDERLRAAILWRRGESDAALGVLGSAKDDTLRHFKSFLLITVRRVEEAEALLTEVSKETAETFQLRGLCRFANRDLAGARLWLQKALERSPRWVSLQYTSAVIDYFGALAAATVPQFIPSWPEPVHPVYTLLDDEARQRLRRAAATFNRLAELPQLGEDERSCLEAWHIACLAIDLEQRDLFEKEAAELLAANPTHHRVLAWAVVARLEPLINGPAEAIRQLLIDKKAMPEQVLVLTQYYVAINKPRKAATLLNKHRALFESSNSIAVWAVWVAQIEGRLGRIEKALRLVESAGLEELESRLLTARILVSACPNDPDRVRRNLEDSYKATDDPRFLLDWVELNAKTKAWPLAASRSRELLQQIPTPEVFRLVAFCLHQAQEYSLCLEVLTQPRGPFAHMRMPGELRQMRVHCQMELGLIPAAVFDAEQLAKEDPSLHNLVVLAQVYASVGDFQRLCVTAREVLRLGHIPPDVLLRLSAQTRWEDKALSTRLWRKATEVGVSDDFIVSALQLGFELGLDDELDGLMGRMADLSKVSQEQVRMGSLEDLKAYAQAFHHQAQELNAAYRTTKLPIHLIAPRLNLTLAEIYHTYLNDNSLVPFLWRQPSVFIRSGHRALVTQTDAQAGKYRLNADITAILLAQHFGFLDAVEREFAPIRIAPELLPVLAVMRDRLTSGQARSIESCRKVLSAIVVGRIGVVSDGSSSRTDLPQSLRAGWAYLAETALKERGVVVDFLPLVTGTRPVELNELPSDLREHIVGIRAVLAGLQKTGSLSTDHHQLIMERNSGLKSEPETTALVSGSRLYFSGSSIEFIANLDLIDALTAQYKVLIEQQELDRLQQEVRISEKNDVLARWVTDLLQTLSEGLHIGRYEVISTERLIRIDGGNKQPEDIDDRLGLDSLLSLIRLRGEAPDRVWVDDRFVNSHPLAGRTAVVDSLDVLQQLVTSGALSSESYYELLSRMRAEGARFIPLSKDEILAHLRGARMDAGETISLRNLRRGVAASLLDSRFLRPSTIEGGSFNPGETQFLITSILAVSEALVGVWMDNTASSEDHIAKSNWIVSSLLVPHSALRRIAEVRPEINDHYAFAMAAASLLTRTVAFSLDAAGDETAEQFTSWVYHRLLEPRFVVEQNLIGQTAAYLQDAFEKILSTEFTTHDRRFAPAIIQRYFLRLPEQIRASLGPTSDFLSKIGVRTQGRIEVAGLRFERVEYLTGAREAINGREAKVPLLEKSKTVDFLPTTAIGHGFKFDHPVLHREVVVNDWLHRLLADSPTQREAVLAEIAPMLDVRAKKWPSMLAELASTEDFLRRIEKGEALRERSLPFFYQQLETKVRGASELRRDELFPNEVDAFTSHLRLESFEDLSEAVPEMVDDMLQSLSLAEAIDRFFRMPVQLPERLQVEVRNLSTDKKQELIRSLLQRHTSPLWRAQFEVMLGECLAEEEVFLSAWNPPPPTAQAELEAYITLVRWTFDELSAKEVCSQWSSTVILAVAWTHGDHLYSLLRSCGWEAESIAETFSFSSARVRVLFGDGGSLESDVSNPHNVTPTVLLSCMSRIARRTTSMSSPDRHMKAWLRSFMLIERDGILFPKLELIPDVSAAPNRLKSPLGSDRLMVLHALAEDEEGAKFASVRSEAQNDAKALLERCEKYGWAVLRAAFGNYAIPDEYREVVRVAVSRSFEKLSAEDDLKFAVLASSFLRFVDDAEARMQFRLHLLRLSARLNELGQVDIHSPGMLLEAAFNYARCSSLPVVRVSEFANLAADLAAAWPSMGTVIRPLIEGMCGDLPLNQTTEMWRLNLRLRTQ